MVYRAYVEKKNGLANEAQALKNELVSLLGITSLENVRILNRYDLEGLEKELFDYAKTTVLSEPQLDIISEEPNLECDRLFATEFLPGQFDQRANSCAECIQMISKGERPLVRSAKVYCLYGNLDDAQLEQIKKYVINPVEAREASLEKPETLAAEYDIPESVKTLEGFIKLDEKGLADFVNEYGLAMDLDDIKFCQNYFISEQRDPTITEIRMIDTYWSDHCRHTTFLTNIDSVKFEDELLQRAYDDYIAVRKEIGRTKPVNLMDIGTVAGRYLKSKGLLAKLDESEEINACTVKIDVEIDGKAEKWLLLFKNETHNHP
ncbi:MAG: phosphoribosylformylglycinamidine synthase, partial [Clostridia bacterium]|nr:phosphoribosylformylglycinamidine synthase [Clostridia bacterium]